MTTRYMLMHKLHFVNVYVALSTGTNSVPKIYCGKTILASILIKSKQDLYNLEWHYWSRTNLHRYFNIEFEILDKNNIKNLNIDINLKNFDIDNSIIAINFDNENILNLETDKNNNYYTEIAVIATFKALSSKQLLNKQTNIAIFDINNQVKYTKKGICMHKYIDMCIKYKQSKNINLINKYIDELNYGQNNNYSPQYDDVFYLAWLEYKNNTQPTYILNKKLTQSLLDYEGSTGIDFDILFETGILPEQMIYFYNQKYEALKTKNFIPICTYVILEHAKSEKWTANGGIAHYLNSYINNKNLNISSDSTNYLELNIKN